jgi:hypothetical protein
VQQPRRVRLMGRSDKRAGDVLGLGNAGSSITNREDTFVNSSESETDEARRRRRMSEGADELTPVAGPPQRSSGATGIDMGSGGEGTDIE